MAISGLLFVFVAECAIALYINRQGGVVRDVPELYVTQGNKIDHRAYNDKIYKLNKPFSTDKRHVMILGNSFGRDFANVLLESQWGDSLEICFIAEYDMFSPENIEKGKGAEYVFYASLSTNTTETGIEAARDWMTKVGLDPDSMYITGMKLFGVNNGLVYRHRNEPDYFEQRQQLSPEFIARNKELKNRYGDRYVELIDYITDSEGRIRVFSDDRKYISQDCRHFSRGGAEYFGRLLSPRFTEIFSK